MRILNSWKEDEEEELYSVRRRGLLRVMLLAFNAVRIRRKLEERKDEELETFSQLLLLHQPPTLFNGLRYQMNISLVPAKTTHF